MYGSEHRTGIETDKYISQKRDFQNYSGVEKIQEYISKNEDATDLKKFVSNIKESVSNKQDAVVTASKEGKLNNVSTYLGRSISEPTKEKETLRYGEEKKVYPDHGYLSYEYRDQKTSEDILLVEKERIIKLKNECESYYNDYVSAINRVDSSIENLRTAWQSASAEKIYQEYETKKTELEEAKNIFETYIEYISKVPGIYETLDETYSSMNIEV